MTSTDAMRAAWDALIRGDRQERDRQVAIARAHIEAETVERALLRVDFYVTMGGVVIPTKLMAKAAGAIQ